MRLSFLLLAPFVLSGCAPRDAARDDPIRGVAASVVAARAFDRAKIASRRGDQGAFEAARDDWERAREINQSPRESRNRHLVLSDALNRAGYTLADEGTTPAEFDRAIALTKQALQEANKFIESLPANDPALPDAIFSRASGPRDSHAWALFKRGRFAEARAQQELVLKELAESGSKQPVPADIPFHMAEIYRALGEKTRARQQYEAALELPTDALVRGRIESGLKALGAAAAN
ncbi:MAG: hypothetical protein KY445_12570 [Armatimonadetes bacterium]|nr:hypothetical protein [Armatimonadota bacterium]